MFSPTSMNALKRHNQIYSFIAEHSRSSRLTLRRRFYGMDNGTAFSAALYELPPTDRV